MSGEDQVQSGGQLGGSKKYDVFLSYSHGTDDRRARALQSGLRRYAKSWRRPRALRVFRDKSSLSANDNLWNSLEAHLRESRYFVLMASPDAARSAWVRREVSYWRGARERDTFLIALTDGEILWDQATADFDWAHTTALPQELTGWFESEPHWVDLSWTHRETDLSLRNSEFRSSVGTLAATIHNKPKDQLDGDDIREHRTAARLRRATVLVLSLLLVMVTGLVVVIAGQRNAANDQRDRALASKLASRSETLGDADPVVAKLLSVAAWRISPTPDARAGMLRAAAHPGIAKLTTDSEISSVAFSKDGRTLAVGENNAVQLWDVRSRRRIGAPLAGHTGAVQSVVFSPDRRILASGGDDGTVRLWDLRTHKQLGGPISGQVVFAFPVAFDPSVAFSPDGRALAIGHDDGTVRLWDVHTHGQIGTPLSGHPAAQLPLVGPAVAFSPDGTMLATAAIDGTLRFWDARTHRQIGLPVAGHPADATAFDSPSIVFNPDGRTLATAASDGKVRLWDVAKHELVGVPEIGPTPERVNAIPAVMFSSDGRMLATGSDNGTFRIWDVDERRQIGSQITGHTGSVRSLAFSPDGRTLVSAARDRTVRLWNVSGYQQASNPLAGHTGPVYSVAFSPDGKTLATGSDDGGAVNKHGSDSACLNATKMGCTSGGPGRGPYVTALLWDVGKRRQIGHPLTKHADSISSVAFSPGGGVLATGSQHGTVRLWDVGTRRQTGHMVADRDGDVSSIAFSPDGKMLVTAVRSKVLVWDVGSQRQAGSLETGQSYSASQLAFSPDGKTLAAGVDTGHVLLWDVESRRRAGDPLTGHTGTIHSVAFNPGGNSLVTAGDDGTVRLWDVRHRHQIGEPLTGHTGPVFAVAFAPDGKTLATASGDNSVRLWDVATRANISEGYLGHALPVMSIGFSPDGRTLASGSEDNTVRLWDLGYMTDVVSTLCAVANRSLTPGEWERYVTDLPYRQVCP